MGQDGAIVNKYKENPANPQYFQESKEAASLAAPVAGVTPLDDLFNYALFADSAHEPSLFTVPTQRQGPQTGSGEEKQAEGELSK